MPNCHSMPSLDAEIKLIRCTGMIPSTIASELITITPALNIAIHNESDFEDQTHATCTSPFVDSNTQMIICFQDLHIHSLRQ